MAQPASPFIREPEPFSPAPSTLVQDLTRAFLDRIQSLREPWAKMKESQQGQLIEMINDDITGWVIKAMSAMRAAEVSSVDAILEKYQDGEKGIKISLNAYSSLANVTALHSRTNMPVIIWCVSKEDFAKGEDPKPEPDQPELPTNPNPRDAGDGGFGKGDA